MSYIAPMTYAAAPTMTSMYATPGPSMYMPTATVPTTTAVAAPVATTTAVAAPVSMTTAAPSYVAAPQFAMPAPVSLTAGLVEPAKLEAERVAYEKALAGQLDKQSKAVFEE